MFGIEAITPTDFGSRFRRGLGLTLVAVTAWLTAPTACRAGPIIDYGFSNASAVLDGTPVSISGLFTVSEGLGVNEFNLEYFASIQAGGGEYTCSGIGAGICLSTSGILLPGPNLVEGAVGGLGLRINFADNLGSGSADPIASVEINGVASTSVTGAAVPIGRPIDYSFTNTSSAVLNGSLETIAGGFVYDPLTQIQYPGDSVRLTGPAPFAGFYICDDVFATNGRAINECVLIPLGAIFTFANDLGSPADFDPLASVELNGVTSTATTGGVGVGPIPAPEPTSLAILGVALGLFLVGPWAIRRAGQSHADQPDRPGMPALNPRSPMTQTFATPVS